MASSLAVVAADGVRLEQALHGSKSDSSLGVVVQVHGINADMDEGGMYVRLADRLAEAGFGGHRGQELVDRDQGIGESGGEQEPRRALGQHVAVGAVAVAGDGEAADTAAIRFLGQAAEVGQVPVPASAGDPLFDSGQEVPFQAGVVQNDEVLMDMVYPVLPATQVTERAADFPELEGSGPPRVRGVDAPREQPVTVLDDR